MIRFTAADLERAHAEWSCSCGPAALAAICGLTLDDAGEKLSVANKVASVKERPPGPAN